MSDSFAINAFFISSNVRDVIQEGFGDYTPILLSDVPILFNSGSLPIDIALVQVTPPNLHGRVSLGISVDITRSAIDNASLVIAEVNPNMPWTHGDTDHRCGRPRHPRAGGPAHPRARTAGAQRDQPQDRPRPPRRSSPTVRPSSWAWAGCRVTAASPRR
jgi:acyl-CoA hydrolase